MTRIKSFSRFVAVLALALLTAVPMFAAARGSADFSHFVAIGDSRPAASAAMPG